MPDSDQVETHFSNVPEMPDLEDYRPLSPLVICACAVAILSVVAVIHPVLWVVPAVAVVLSVASLLSLSSLGSRYSGRRAAWVALCFAVLVGSYAPAKAISDDRHICRESWTKVEAWLSMLQAGQVEEAHQLTQEESQRFQGPGALADFYSGTLKVQALGEADPDALEGPAGASAATELIGFRAEPGVAKLLQFGSHAKLELLRHVSVDVSGYNRLTVTHEFLVRGVIDGQPDSQKFSVRSSRTVRDKTASWEVGRLQLSN